jgi:signal transduction histidine kinase
MSWVDKSEEICDAPVIIVTDDHRMTRHMIRSILEQEGSQVLEAENGRDALELFFSKRPDLIITDIMMPVMNGLDLCTRIKETPEGKHVPILVFTAHNKGKEVDDAFRAGASDFINKPLNPEELRHRVRRLLYLRALQIKREAAEAKLQSSYKKIRVLSRKVLHAYEEERARLARELHDELGMTLTTLKLNLQLLNKDITESGYETKNKLTSIMDLVNNALAATRDKARLMRPPSLDDLGLVTVVQNMVQELSRHINIQTQVRTSGEYRGLPVEVETALYRCIQEAMTNVARHSAAKNVMLNIDFDENEISVSIKDDGIGFDTSISGDSGGHLGLQGMQERVALLGGDIMIESAREQGTEIKISIPKR